VVAQVVVEWRAERTRRSMQILAVKPGAEQTGYFRIGPYQNTPEDRAKFRRADHAENKALEWIKNSDRVPLYLCGDSGSGKSSLLNAFVLPVLREQGWTVVEARAWQDPERALRDALRNLPGPRRRNAESQGLREMVEDPAKHATVRLLIVLDQFEEFVILAKPEQQQKFAAFVAELSSRPVKSLALLFVMRSEYQVPLEETGLPMLRNGENLFQVGRFTFPAAGAFIKRSGLDLQPDAIDQLLTSAAELDETPGMVRPITLNVVGYVLASGKAVAPSLEAGVLIRRYIERTVEQPGIRDWAPQLLEQMITEQGTKRPRSEAQLAADTKLRRAEVRAVLNGLDEAGLSRTRRVGTVARLCGACRRAFSGPPPKASAAAGRRLCRAGAAVGQPVGWRVDDPTVLEGARLLVLQRATLCADRGGRAGAYCRGRADAKALGTVSGVRRLSRDDRHSGG
jgi:hypothetical protein